MDTGTSSIIMLSLILCGCNNKKIGVSENSIDVQLEEPEDFDFDVEYGRKAKDEKPQKKSLARSLKSTRARARKPKLVLKKPIRPIDIKYTGNKVDLSISNDIVAPCDGHIEKVESVGETQTLTLASKSDPTLRITLGGISNVTATQGQEVKSGDVLGKGNSVSVGFERANSTIIANDEIKFNP